jgi:glycosyltransferase involved in cell wall biosynthesis
LRVLHLIHAFSAKRGGPYAALGGFIEAGRGVGIESEVLTTDVDGRERHGWARDVPVHFTRSRLGQAAAIAPGLLAETARRAPSFDVLHVHGLWRLHGFAATLTSRRRGIPMIVRTCGHLAPRTFGHRSGRKRLYFSLIERRVIDTARLLHFTTEAERRASEPWTEGKPALILPPPVATLDLPRRAAARATVGVAEGARLVVCVARLDPIKRHDLLVAALDRLPPNVLMAFVGPDPGGREAELKRAATPEAAPRLRFPGMVDRDGLAAWLGAADAFVSVSEHENFGLSIAEAAMAGVPVAIPRDLYIAGELEGRTTTVEREPESIARGLAGILGSDDASAAGRALRERAAALWSPQAIGARLLEAYRGALSS